MRNLRAVDNGGYVDKRWIGEDLGQRTEITSLTLKSRIDQPLQLLAQNGALMPYGPNIPAMFRRAAFAYAAKILKGAKPGDLPIERPSRFEFVIHLKTAKAPVARLRSWRAAAVARGGLTPAACGCRRNVRVFSARCFGVYDSGLAKRPAGSVVSAAPQDRQNFLPGVTGVPQLRQVASSQTPQSSQNLRPARFS